MAAINSNNMVIHAKKICCPECHGRICDLVVPKQDVCRHKYRVIFDGSSEYLIAIKCQKCGEVIGLSIAQ